nr:histidine phosphatase family protein [Bdellovibrio sp. HAGR004]
MQKIIHLFRHGLTDWNHQRRLQGHTDIPLNSEGQNQALALQDFFQHNPVDLFVSSDLSRARQTAEIANTQLAHPLFISSHFREVFLGDIEGWTREEVAEKFGAPAWENWLAIQNHDGDFRFPGAESSNQAIQRFAAGLTELCKQKDFKAAGLCTHGLIMRRFLHSLRPDLIEALPTPNCVVYTVKWDPSAEKFIF